MNIQINEQIRALVETIADIYRSELSKSTATGNLQNFQTIIDINDTTFQVSFELADYWKYVEYGRRAGKMPPIDAIEGWVKIKPVVPNAINGKVPSSRQLAFLIARKIGREGIPAKRPLEATLYSDVTEQVIQDIKNEIIRQLNNYLLGQTQ